MKNQIQAILVAMALIICAVFGMLIGTTLASLLPFPTQTLQIGGKIVLSQLVGLGLLSVAFVLGKYKTVSVFKFEIDVQRDVIFVIGVAVVMILASVLMTIISNVAGVQTAENTIQKTLESNTANVYMFAIASILFVGPLEELFFRGTIQRHLKDSFTPKIAVGITAALFSCVHIMSMVGSSPVSFLSYLAVLFIGGVTLGLSYEYTKNLLVPMAGHGIYNAILALSLLMS